MKPKVLLFYDKSGCSWWRAWLPCEEMRKQGLIELRYLDVRYTSTDEMIENLKWCDIVYGRGIIGVEALTMIRHYKKLGLKTVVDYDDLHFNVSPMNPAYKNFGLEEIEFTDPKTGVKSKLWEDGKHGFDIKANKIKFHSYKGILEEADLITTTTLYLKNAMAEISGREDNIAVLPNAIDFDQWKPFDTRDKHPDKFRFGWAVSASHGEDWVYFKPILIEFIKRHPDAKFVVLGDTQNIDIRKIVPENQLEWMPFADLWAGHYTFQMAMLGLDCAIAPLADIEFNRCKSPLKYAEYTAFGYPVIAQKMLPYTECIVNGENGLLAGTQEEWLNCLEAAYSNKSLMAKIHFNALHTVREFFDLEKVAREWAETFKKLIG